jgi:hypothetical protein
MGVVAGLDAMDWSGGLKVIIYRLTLHPKAIKLR